MKTIGRLLNMGKNCAAMNMAIDEAILIAQKENPNPTLRFYNWIQPAFSFGYFQNIAAEVDVKTCRSERIELVKRMTGGGTVIHGSDLTYSLIVPRTSDEKSITEMYEIIGTCLVKSFQKLGIPAECYSDESDQSENSQNICLTNPAENDVMCNGKKLAGVSVRRNRHGVLFQGYISLDMPTENILKHVSKDKETRKEVCDRSTAINTQGHSITRNTLINAICETFDIGIPFELGSLSAEEHEAAEDLTENKYGTQAWNYH